MVDNLNQNQNLTNPNPPIDPPAGDPPVPPAIPPVPPADDLSKLFTPEEVTAKKEFIASAKTEEERRSKLSPEDLKKEDDAKVALEADTKVPEIYADFKIPDGMEVDKELLTETLPMFKELGLSQGKAQKIIDLYSAKIAPAFIKRQADAWNAQKEGWKADVQKDTEIGGDKFEASVKEAQRVLNTLGTPELKKVFDDYGLGNHPEFVRVFARMAQHLKEDTLEARGKGKPATNTMDGIASVLYDKTDKK